MKKEIFIKILLIVLFNVFGAKIFGQLELQVLDENKQPLPGATVLLLPDSNYISTNLNGVIDLPDTLYIEEVHVRYIGYKSHRVRIPSSTEKIEIILQPLHEELETITVFEEHVKQEKSLAHLHLEEDFFKKNNSQTLAQTLDALPGLNVMNVGTGIAKPVIRGLFGNRILINENGIKQEGQQWGNDHGLEIDPFNVDRIEIIKGPAALQYGSDALGGVINIRQKKIPKRNSIEGEFTTVYKSNNALLGISGELGGNYKNFFVRTRYSRQSFGDFQVPADQFEYNTFTLPIENQAIKNSAGQEESISIGIGYNGKRSITKVDYRRYSLRAGIFPGAIGIPRTYILSDDGDNRNIEIPFQRVSHDKWTLNQTFMIGKHHWVTNVGYQINKREEHSLADFHSVPASELDGQTLGIGLELRTLSLNSHMEYHLPDNWETVLGTNLQWQHNQRRGYDFLLPDYNTFRGGVFGIIKWDPVEEIHFNGGLRIDYGRNENKAFKRFVYSSNELLIDSLEVFANTANFQNFAFSTGANFQFFDTHQLKLNLAKSFRIPYLNETASNGVHHGTFRHEKGNADLTSEQGYQFDVGWIVNGKTTRFEINGYVNYFQDYIYLRPSARFSRLPEAGQIFEYTQNNALFTGFEAAFLMDFNVFDYETNIEYLHTLNIDERLPLPFSSPNSLFQKISIHPFRNKTWKSLELSFNYQWVFAQNRVDRNENITRAYHLFGTQVFQEFMIGNSQLSFILEVQNLFDIAFLKHLSRYRILNLPEQGRNIILKLHYTF